MRFDDYMKLPPALFGDRVEITSPAGRLSLYVSGTGPPLLLVHSINAAASAAEVRPLHEHFSKTHRSFCLDLPGFGFSARDDRRYTPRLMTDAIHAAAEFIRGDGGRGDNGRGDGGRGDGAIDALALSLSSEYLARAALERPAAFRSIALVSPTGFRGGAARRDVPGSTRGIPWLYRALRGPGWGEALFRALTRPKVIRYFLRRTWGSKDIDEPLWAYDILTTRQPGALYAPLFFLSGYLFSGDIHDVYTGLTVPVWMTHGIRGDFTDYRNKKLVAGRANWRFATFATGALPHFEVPQEFCDQYRAFLKSVDDRVAEPAAPAGA